MAKKSTSKKTVWYKDKIFWLGLVILVAIAGGWYYHDSHSGKASKEDFEKAQASIDKVYSDIVAKLGQPANYKKSQSCSRPSQKFSQGPLSCSTGIEFVYSVPEAGITDKYYDSISPAQIQSSTSFKPTKSPSGKSNGQIHSSSSGRDYYEHSDALFCGVRYVHGLPSETYLLPANSDSSKKLFYVNMSCYGPAGGEYFPILK